MKKLLLLFAVMLSTVGAWAQEATHVVGLISIPTEATLPEDIETGYYLLEEVNPDAAGKPGGFLKTATEGVDAIVTPQGRANSLNVTTADERYIWYIEKNQDNTYTISTANKLAAWQAPWESYKHLVSYENRANLKFVTETITLGNSTSTPVAGSFIVQNTAGTACFHYSESELGSWHDANPTSVMMFKAYKVTSLLKNEAVQSCISGLTALPTEKTSPADIVTGYYLLKEVNPNAGGKPGGYLKTVSENFGESVTPQGKNTSLNLQTIDATYIWYIEKNGDTYKISTANKWAAWQAPEYNEKRLVNYESRANLKFVTAEITLGGHTSQAVEGSFIIQNEGNNSCVHYSGNNLGSWTDANPASVMMFEAYKVDDMLEMGTVNYYPVYYNYKFNGELRKTIEVSQREGSKILSPLDVNIYFMDFNVPTGYIAADANRSMDINCTPKSNRSLPFTLSSDINNPVWQVVEMHRYGGDRYWMYNKETKKVDVVYNTTTKYSLLSDEYLWCFVGDEFGVRIYNKAAGTEVSLNTTPNNPLVGVPSNENDIWAPVLSEASSDANAGCFLYTDKSYMNRTASGSVGYYDQRDNGSTCYFFAPSVVLLDEIQKIAQIPDGSVGGYIVSSEDKEAFDNALDAVEKESSNLELCKSLAEAVKAIMDSPKVAYADGYYRIYSAQPGLCANNKGVIYDKAASANNPFRWGTIARNNVNAIVKLTTDAGKVVLQAVNNGMYMQGVAGAENTSMSANGHITLTELGYGQYNLKYGNGTMHANRHGEGTGSGSDVLGWDGGVNSASAWYVVPATELDITITNAGWATTCLPFDVVLPEELTAYALTGIDELNGEETGTVSLISKAGIPAKQGALLNGARGTYTLSIEETASNWEANKLSGTTDAKDMSTLTGDVYLLTADGENSAKLSKLVLASGADEAKKTLAANKAYLNIPTSSARFLVFNFDEDNTTAIENIETESGNVKAEIYDLAGRRVQNAQKGLYIVNGKKVVK